MEGINGRNNLKITLDCIHVSSKFIFLMMFVSILMKWIYFPWICVNSGSRRPWHILGYRLIYKEWTHWISFKNCRMFWFGEIVSFKIFLKLCLINPRKQLGNCLFLTEISSSKLKQSLSGIRWWMFHYYSGPFKKFILIL